MLGRSPKEVVLQNKAIDLTSRLQGFARTPSKAVLGDYSLALGGFWAGAFFPWPPAFNKFRAQPPMFRGTDVGHTKL